MLGGWVDGGAPDGALGSGGRLVAGLLGVAADRRLDQLGRGGEVGPDRVDARLGVDHDAADVPEHLGLVDHADVRVGARDGDRRDPGPAAAGVDDRDGLGPGVEHEARRPEVDHHALAVAAQAAHEGAGRGVDAAEAGQLLEERAVVDDEQQGLALHVEDALVLGGEGVQLHPNRNALGGDGGVGRRGRLERGQFVGFDQVVSEHGSLHWCPYIPKEGASKA